MDIDYEGRVAIVTGAGAGLGRAHALLLGRRGARIVVNDVSGEAAQGVVDEIATAGGEAVAVPGSVTDGDAIVTAAMNAFGQLDVVVNNAGIVRDRSFAKMSDEELHAVLDVHLVGTFRVTQAAWEHLRASGSGRVVNTTSGAGVYGNFGQANYSAAKMGIVGLSRTLAIEGAKAGIKVNVIAPFAASQMTANILSPAELEALQPELVSPLVAYLCWQGCEATGQIFSVAGGHVARIAVVEGPGVSLGTSIAPEDIAASWEQICDLDGYVEPASVAGQAEKVNRAIGLA